MASIAETLHRAVVNGGPGLAAVAGRRGLSVPSVCNQLRGNGRARLDADTVRACRDAVREYRRTVNEAARAVEAAAREYREGGR